MGVSCWVVLSPDCLAQQPGAERKLDVVHVDAAVSRALSLTLLPCGCSLLPAPIYLLLCRAESIRGWFRGVPWGVLSMGEVDYHGTTARSVRREQLIAAGAARHSRLSRAFALGVMAGESQQLVIWLQGVLRQ